MKMNGAGGVLCPVCGIELHAGLASTPDHIFEEHGFRVTEGRREGYNCRVFGCMAPYNSYRSWKRHTEAVHLRNRFDFNDGGAVGLVLIDAAAHMGVQDPNQENAGVNLEAADQGNLNADIAEEDDNNFEERDLSYNSLETLPNGMKDIKHAAARMVVNMRSVAAMTRVGVQRAMHGAEQVLKVSNMTLKEEVGSYLTSINRVNTRQAQDLLRKFDNTTPFDGMKSNRGQISAIERYYHFLKPRTLPVRERLERRLGDEGVLRQVPVTSTFEYVSPIDICKLVWRKTVVNDYVTSRRPSEDGILYGYTDASQFRNHEFFQRYPNAYQLALYYDGVSTTRPLGPKEGLYELGNFSISILNMPPGINATLSGIHPVVLANVQDCKGTFEDVLYLLRDDLIRLANGVDMFLDGNFVEIRGALVAVKGDNKALHELLGYLACGARFFCRLCMITRQQLHSGEVILGERRTVEMFNNHLQEVDQNQANSSRCGLRCRTVLHDLPFFHALNNECSDLMHDGAEGVTLMLIRLCLKDLVCREEPVFDSAALNLRIAGFNFGYQNARDMPSPNFSDESLANADKVHKQKSNAGQTMTLHRALPFLLDSIGGTGIPEDHAPSQMLIVLSKIYEISSAHQIPKKMIPYLRRLLEAFHRSWYIVFPGVNPINKFHHLQHIPDNILAMGPQRQFWCFREEGKNCPIKRHITVTNNFINPCKTTMEEAQIYQARVWGTSSDDIQEELSFVSKRTVAVSTLPASSLLQSLGFAANYDVTVATAVFCNGYKFRVGEFLLCVKASDTEEKSTPHQFGKILSIICPGGTDKIWFAVEAWETCGLVERYNAYQVKLGNDQEVNGSSFLAFTMEELAVNFPTLIYGEKVKIMQISQSLKEPQLSSRGTLFQAYLNEDGVLVRTDRSSGSDAQLFHKAPCVSASFFRDTTSFEVAETSLTDPATVTPLDVLQILSQSDLGEQVIDFQNEKRYSEKHHKISIAKGIVEAFPELADTGDCPWTSWYDYATVQFSNSK
ncbi:Poly(3-hydroxyalkanoate) polymerase [Frankliniella fusca]|uniref:Poly(3-hydroxyalkanoate) polymerase n=1 Tax=Frankliniella fusca TaxID=407009 RepID=A0AAE1GYJ0_9NEOP|nr:Poly(3-hydroxyalkanoate) polymerase [Frankliniella fusca]